MMDFLKPDLVVKRYREGLMSNEIINEFSNEDLIRSFEEFDEKLPHVAKVIVRRGVNFAILTLDNDPNEETPEEFEECREVYQSIFAILCEMVACTSEMTADEFEYYVDILLTACELVVMVKDGLVYEEEGGKFFLSPEGKSLREVNTGGY